MRPVCNCSFILYFQQDVKFDGLCRGYCFWKIKCKKMLLVRRGLRKDSWHASILYQERTVDTPQSYIRRGQWTHLNPMSGEDSGHTSILSGEDSEHTSILARREQWTQNTYISGEATPRSWGRETSRSLIMAHRASKTPSLKARGKDGDEENSWETNKPSWGTRRNVNKL
jgi:hypothetical protein